jgi:hypothetical protein
MSSTPVPTAVVIALLLHVRAPSAQREEPPSLAQMRDGLGSARQPHRDAQQLRTLTAEQKQYVASILLLWAGSSG